MIIDYTNLRYISDHLGRSIHKVCKALLDRTYVIQFRPLCLFCNSYETVVHAFLECANVIRLWRSIGCWIRRELIDRSNFQM